MDIGGVRSLNHATDDINAARDELRSLVTSLFNKLDQLKEIEDDFELDPDKNIIENFNCKRQMKCEKCSTQFSSWSEIESHNSTHHENEVGDPRVCNICNTTFTDWQERNNHMLLQHPIDSRFTAAPAPAVQNSTALWCCSMCSSQHFLDQNHWKNHYNSFHAKYMGHKTYNWMVTVCDIKGRGIVNDSSAALLCTLCDVQFPYAPDIFNFEFHAKSALHIEKVKEFVIQKKRLPMKFLRITNLKYEITGLFHPHELQSSCCCRNLACQFCGFHKSMINKFPDGSAVWCNICESNVSWTNIEVGSEHVKSTEHYNNVCSYVVQHGFIPVFNAMFKKQGQFIESVSSSRR